MEKYYVSIDVGGTKVKYAIFDADKNLQHTFSHGTNLSFSAEEFFDNIAANIKNFCKEKGLDHEGLIGVGVGLPSFIKFDEGVILMTSNIPNLNNFPAKSYLSTLLGKPVAIDNDGNVAAIAEHRHGAGRGSKHMLYCPVSTGISSAIIINGKPFRGSYGWAGESGHTLITPHDGTACGCKNEGCFMSHVSGSMIVKRVREKIKNGETSLLWDMVDGDLSKLQANHILEGYHKNDEVSIWAIHHMAEYMGMWLFNIYQILNINTFVFGGGLVNFGKPLFEKAISIFHEYNHIDLPVHFRFAELKEDFGIIGALELLIDEIGDKNHGLA